jgi:hypothetical protein
VVPPSGPTSAAEDFAFRWAGLLFLELVSLGTHAVDVGKHSLQQRFSRGCGYSLRPQRRQRVMADAIVYENRALASIKRHLPELPSAARQLRLPGI